ncbi:hypothetical protein [Pelagibacterium lentulum]|uniref:Uncharacterized protein n=1 Tax=Pelagibacterium lentulum TaxID=2029865 RepID=A0A916RIW3_9HYPH|nr:hypothetical protein [Pelagibacterium lentulum]GGA57599.1 hypothetical protein GCM10011499_29760 [Pelagibacterium lentulum]
MVVENIMFFALGFFGAGLIGMVVGTAVWNRAVRLTKRRIEAATPVTLNEFRADKDKLRAVHAVEIRKLEIRNDMLREKLSSLVSLIDANGAEMDALKAERDEQYDAIGALQVREQELVARIRDLERDSAALAARVRQSDEGYVLPIHSGEKPEPVSAEQLSGDYRADVEDLLTALSIERQRNAFLEEQARMLLARLEKRKKGSIKDEAIALLRDTLAANDDPQSGARVALHQAETRISSAESRLNALLADASGEPVNGTGAGSSARHLAEDLSSAERLDALKTQVLALEAEARDAENSQHHQALRTKLGQIAAGVSALVYQEDAAEEEDLSESLFDKVLKFSDGSFDPEELEHGPADTAGPVSDRLVALRDMHVR